MILLIDNYDSFTYNLAQYLGEFCELEVLRNDDENLFEVAQGADGLVFSPGPGWPSDAGDMEQLIRVMAPHKPILGICLGHQAIAECFGSSLVLAKHVLHGKQSQMRLCEPSAIFDGIRNEVAVMRYHSIVVEELSEEFVVMGRSLDDDEIMAFQHKSLPIYGLQFHPESIGTPDGLKMIENFVKVVYR